MIVSFSIFGPAFKSYEFLLAAVALPSTINLWDPEEEQLPCSGFTLVFTETAEVGVFPKTLGRFLLTNKSLLISNAYYCKETEKEITVNIKPKELEQISKQSKPSVYSFHPGAMRLLGKLNIKLHFTIVE